MHAYVCMFIYVYVYVYVPPKPLCYLTNLYTPRWACAGWCCHRRANSHCRRSSSRRNSGKFAPPHRPPPPVSSSAATRWRPNACCSSTNYSSVAGKFTDLRFCLLVGGDSMEEQFAALAHNPDVVMATPGRLLHHLEEVGMGLGQCQYLVFDECDRYADGMLTVC